MNAVGTESVTRLLVALTDGDHSAVDTLLPLIYDELRRLAASYLRRERLDQALKELAEIDPQKSRIVELRYFGGLTFEETAEVLGVSPITVKRHWRMVKAWLFGRIR